MPINTGNMINVVNQNLPYETHSLYDVTFHTDTIQTLVTNDPSRVDSWISEIVHSLRRHNPPIVGLNIELRPNTQPGMDKPIAILQLCVGTRCLVYQMFHAPSHSISLLLDSFLADSACIFVGIAFETDVQSPLASHSLFVSNYVDLRILAVEKVGDLQLYRAGLRTLGLRVLGKDFEKPQSITSSRWDNRRLTAEQVQYATIDAFVSFEVGRRLCANSRV